MNTAKYIQQKPSADDFWEQLFNDFQAHGSDINKLGKWAQSAMFVLHLRLLFNHNYVQALKKAENKIINKQHLVSSIFKSDFLNVKLISMTPERSLPLHDHPGTSGSMMVLSGRVHAIACDQDNLEDKTQAHSQLKIVADKTLSTGDSSCFTKTHHNIHSFKALTERAVIIIVHVNPFAVAQQSYFFPASPQQKSNSHILTQRVRAQTLQNTHRKIKEVSNETNIKANLI